MTVISCIDSIYCLFNFFDVFEVLMRMLLALIKLSLPDLIKE